jgi:hypothetical protein
LGTRLKKLKLLRIAYIKRTIKVNNIQAHPNRFVTMQTFDPKVFDYEMNETMRADLTQVYMQNSWYKENFAKMEQLINLKEQENRMLKTRLIQGGQEYERLKARLMLSEQERERLKANDATHHKNDTNDKIPETKFNTREELYRKLTERAKKTAEETVKDAAQKNNSEERVKNALKIAKSPLAKIRVLAKLVGVVAATAASSNPNGSGSTEYKTLWRSILMIVHDDKRKSGISPQMEDLYNCVCKQVNDLPKQFKPRA